MQYCVVNNYNNVIICCNNGETKLALNVFNNVTVTQQKVQVGKRGRGSITNLIFVKQPAQRFACDSNRRRWYYPASSRDGGDKIVQESLISFDQARETLSLKIPS